MPFHITVFLQVVVLTTFNLCQCNCLSLDSVNSIVATDMNGKETRQFIGENLAWIYERNGSINYMESHAAHTSTKSLYIFTQECVAESNHVHVSISFTDEYNFKYYLNVHSSSHLYRTSNEDDRTIFQFIPIPGSDTKFYIHYNSTEPLITPSGSGPFIFFTKSRYPNEHAAEFYAYPSYGGQLVNILPTLEQIRNGDYGNKILDYERLLSEMRKNNHHLEHELFTVGIYIKEDLGVTNKVYFQLPVQVQLIVSGEPLTLYYKRSPHIVYPMKYNCADNHTDIFPYIFTYSNTRNNSNTWAITNIGPVAEHQLFLSSLSPFSLDEKLSGDKEFVFKLKLTDGAKGFNIYNPRSLPLVTFMRYTPFVFGEYTDYENATFYVEKYSI